MSKAEAFRLMGEGDKLFGQGQICNVEDKILRAELCYTKAIELYPEYTDVYVGRSAARATLGDHWNALKDAEKAISLCPRGSTGYARKGFALAAMSHYHDAIEAYKTALKIDPGNVMLKKELARVEEAYDNKYKDLIEKLKAKPHTREWLNDPDYLQNVKKIAQGSWYLREYVNNGGDITDWRLVHADLIVSGFDKYITISGTSEQSEVVEDLLKAPQDKSTPTPKAIEPKKPNYEESPQNRRLALKENGLRIEAYKRKDYNNALKHCNRAIEFDPKDIIVYNNKAAVYFEQKEYEKCIKECENAIEIGRENRAEAFTRIDSGRGSRSGSMGAGRSSSDNRGAGAPSPVSQEPLPEAKKKAIKWFILECLANPDENTMVAEVKRQFPPQYHADVVTEILNVAIEKASLEVAKVAKFLLHLVSTNTISADDFLAGLKEIVEFAPDLHIDVPMLYDYLGMFIAPHIEKKHITFVQIIGICDIIISSNEGQLLLQAVIKDLTDSMGPSFVKSKWQESGLQLKDWMSEDQVAKWLEDNKFEFLQGNVCSEETK